MKAIIQRVKSASVSVDSLTISNINNGILTFLAVEKGDTETQLEKLIEKIVSYRVFEDEQGKMNLSIKDLSFEHLIVSQFTLAADTNKGKRPSFTNAESPDIAEAMYLKAIELSNGHGIKTFGGKFQAEMKVELINDGPVTFLLEA